MAVRTRFCGSESAEYLLSPSQLITTGAPAPIPGGLDHYKAYRVVDASSLDRKIQVTDSDVSDSRRLGKPLFVCLPTQEWHHDEHFPVSHPSDCLVVYELDEREQTEIMSTIDQFGLNELRSQQSKWLCVRADTASQNCGISRGTLAHLLRSICHGSRSPFDGQAV